MNLRGCSFEKDLVQALKAGHWPDGCARELRTHANGCELCRELILVTQTFQRARSESIHTAPAGSPDLLWWRAQLRRRNAAARRVGRPITIAQTFAWLTSLLVAIVFVASQYNHGLGWASWWPEITPSKVLHLLSANVGNWNLLLFLPGLGAVAVLSGIVLYLASERS